MGWLILIVVFGVRYIYGKSIQQKEAVTEHQNKLEAIKTYDETANVNRKFIIEFYDGYLKEIRDELKEKSKEFAEYREKHKKQSWQEQELRKKLERNENEYKEFKDFVLLFDRFVYRSTDSKNVNMDDLLRLSKHWTVFLGRTANKLGARGVEGLWGPDGKQGARYEMEREESEKIVRSLIQKYS